MKKTRRAAAVWMTMSLALSTIFGSTAWGEVIQKTGGNRCTHVHTAECYGNLDETATPSEIGELEPMECTHVCSVESGCILDTEDKKTEDISSEDQEPSDGKASDDEILDDQEVPSVNTPSNAKDNTPTINGTTMPSSKTKVHSWTWYDPEGILIDGKLELTGVTEEAQPSFEEITEYLPQAVIAQVGNSEEWEEENLQLSNWTCAEYVQDENGLWPLEGNYEFTAELPDGYELADGADALMVEVSVAGDQTATTAEIVLFSIYEANGGEQKSLRWDGESNYWGTIKETSAWKNGNIRFTSYGNNNYTLELTNINLGNIYLETGNWTIVLNGSNNLDGKGHYASGVGLYVWKAANATIKAGTEPASLTVSNYPTTGNASDGSSGIQVETSLTIESGNIIATAYRGNKNNPSSGAIYVTTNGTLNINGGSIIATGTGKHGLAAYGKFRMEGGTFKVIGEYSDVIENRGTFEYLGGTLTTNSNSDGSGFMQIGGTTTIAGKEMIADRLWINSGDITITNTGKLTSGSTIIEDGNLINQGEFVSNGAFESKGNGKIQNTGTISGIGEVPEENKTDPGMITFEQPEDVKYDGTVLDIRKLANIIKPENAGALTYEILDESTGEGNIDADGILTVAKVGTFVIRVTTKKTGIHASAKPVKITLNVTLGKFPNEWQLNVKAASGVYNGAKGYPAATITQTGIPKDAKYEYQLATTPYSSSLPEQWQSECPTIVNVSDSGKYVHVRVVTDNYEPKVFVSSNRIDISRRSFNDVEVTITPNTVTYNGGSWNPEIKVTEDWSGASGDEVDSSGYTIYWTNEEGDRVELKDAGTYTAHLMGTREGNYSSEVKTASFTIEKCKLKAYMRGGQLDKIYDGTTNIAEGQDVFVELCDDSGRPDLQDIRPDQVEWAYRSADVGKHYLDAKVITVVGDKVDNYEVVSWTSSLLGVIKPRDFESMTVSAAPLTYDGTEQKPQINVSLDTGLDKVSSSNAKYYYFTDGEDFGIEVPGFKDPGTYTVHVKAEMDNFNPITDKVEVIVQKAAAPTVADLSETYSYKETGEKRVKFTGIPEDRGRIGAVTAQIVSDEGKILDGSPAVDGSELVFKLKGSSKEMIGKTAQIVVTVETQNYENIEIPVTVTLKADPSDNDSENGNSGNNNSGNNSGNGNSDNNNSGSNSGNGNSGSGSNDGNSSSSSSGSSNDDSDYTDSKTTAPKLSDVRSGNAANNAANNVTKDSRKGYQSNSQGVITGADNQVTNDGYSHWMKDSKGWWLRYSDGSYPMGSTGEYHWEKINGRWWAFGPDGYLSTGWIYDTVYQGWFYMDANQGMLTGWQFIDGKWYYLNPISDGTSGIMYAKRRTPDGWLVKEDGSWDEEAGRQ